MKKMSKLIVATAISAALFGTSAMAEDTIKVGIAGPLTGPVAQYGDMEFTGGEMAVEQINAAGGIKGKKLEAIKYDDSCDPKQAVAVANKVVNDGVKFVIGHLCSDSTLPSSDIYEDEGVLMITPAATAPKITERGYKLVFRTTGLDSDQGPTAANYITSVIKPKTIAVIHDKKQYGEGIATAVYDTLKKNGANVVAFEGITAGDKDFSALIAKLKEKNVDFVYYGGYHPELGLILRQSSEKGFKAKFMGPEGVGNKDISAIAGKASEGMFVTMLKKYDQDPANAKLVEAFKAKKQDFSGPFVWTTYAAIQALSAGIENAGEEPEAVADYLRGHKVDTVMGPLEWSDKGDLKNFNFGVYQWHADGTSTSLQ